MNKKSSETGGSSSFNLIRKYPEGNSGSSFNQNKKSSEAGDFNPKKRKNTDEYETIEGIYLHVYFLLKKSKQYLILNFILLFTKLTKRSLKK